MRTLAAGDLAVHLDHVRSVRFVREIRLTSKGTERLCDVDAIATIETARRSFRLGVEVKRTFLSQSAAGAVIADHLRLGDANHVLNGPSPTASSGKAL
jgi:hypothetical protein